MTHYRFVTRAGSSSIHDNEDELKKDKRLIILSESVKYCMKNETDRVRYSDLKKLSNNRLADITAGQETDLGGTFDKYIVEFESTDEPTNRLIERQKISHKKSYLIPNIQRIRNYFTKRNLINLIDETPTHFKTVEPRNYEAGKMSSLVIGEIPEDKNKPPIERMHKLYTVCYYYENGKPVFVENHNEWEKDPVPFYEDDSFVSAFKMTEHRRFVEDMTASPVLVTDPWTINLIQPKNKNMLVDEEDLKKLLSIGKNIVSSNPEMNIGIAIQYCGSKNRG